MKIDVLNISGEKTGRSVELPSEMFGVEPNEHAMYLAVKQYLAHQRQGTHKAKERGEIAGSTRKIKRQKGTGTARAGSMKNPLFRKGGRVFGPRPRNYTIKLNKKVKSIARFSALSSKAQNDGIIVLEDFTFDTPQTKEFVKILSNIDAGHKALVVTGDHDKNLYLSSRNIPGSQVVTANELNTYEIMNAGKLVLSENAIEAMKETFGS